MFKKKKKEEITYRLIIQQRQKMNVYSWDNIYEVVFRKIEVKDLIKAINRFLNI